MNTVDTNLATLTLISEDIIELRFKYDEYEVDVKDQLEFQKAVSVFASNAEIKYSMIILPGRHGGLTSEARENEMFKSDAFSDLKGLAIVTKALHQRLLGNMFLKFKKKKPSYPYKIFKTPEQAIIWLNSI